MRNSAPRKDVPLHVYTALQTTRDPEKLLQGVQKYLSHPYKRKPAPAPQQVWTDGPSRLLYYPAQNARQALFVVPSLINGPEIFDLMPDHSFLRFMTHQYTDIYLLDWGALSRCRHLTLESLLGNILGKAYSTAAQHAQTPLHLMGYCLGGTLAADALRRGYIQPSTLSLLAAPLDFHASKAPWHNLTAQIKYLQRFVRQNGALTRTMLNSYFSMIDPIYTSLKYQKFLLRPADAREARLFVCVEDWLNGGDDIPANLACDILTHYFETNEPKSYAASLRDVQVNVIYSCRDKIVPPQTVLASGLDKHGRLVNHTVCDCGHIGMMASGNAQNAVWNPVLSWVQDPVAFASQQE